VKLVKVNSRGQVSLGSLTEFDYYEARLYPDGRIVLTPVEISTMKREVDNEQRP